MSWRSGSVGVRVDAVSGGARAWVDSDTLYSTILYCTHCDELRDSLGGSLNGRNVVRAVVRQAAFIDLVLGRQG